MSNLIQFLETMGKDPEIGKMSPEQFAAAVKNLAIDDSAQHALLHHDASALNESIGNYTKMMMLLLPAEDDDQGEGKGKGKEDDHDDDQSQENTPSEN